MSPHALAELAKVPSLKDRWVAIDPRGSAPDRDTPLQVALASGAIVVDADDELDVLCARLNAAKLTSLTIVYAGSQAPESTSESTANRAAIGATRACLRIALEPREREIALDLGAAVLRKLQLLDDALAAIEHRLRRRALGRDRAGVAAAARP